MRLARGEGQLIGQPGSNGGVHRGQDLVPRRDLVRRIYERALWATQMRPKIDPVTGLPAAKGHKVPIQGAMVADLVARLERMVESGEDGIVLRLLEGRHGIMQPAKGEGTGASPRRVRFADAPSGLDRAKPVAAPAGPEPPTVVDREGTESVEP